jgi:hypothetical protein
MPGVVKVCIGIYMHECMYRYENVSHNTALLISNILYGGTSHCFLWLPLLVIFSSNLPPFCQRKNWMDRFCNALFYEGYSESFVALE